ncbi:MAG: serine kinase [Phycisphaerae bacterium]
MKLTEIARELDLEPLTPEILSDASPDITAGYVSDLLSDVLAHAPAQGVLVTVQVHMNVIAVAVHANLTAVIFAADRRPEPPVIEKAMAEKITLFVSKDSSFAIVGKLYSMGLRGPCA